jgi:hypothetical protein
MADILTVFTERSDWIKEEVQLPHSEGWLLYAGKTAPCFQDENRIQIYSPESQVGNFLKNKFKIIWQFKKLSVILHQIKKRMININI